MPQTIGVDESRAFDVRICPAPVEGRKIATSALPWRSRVGDETTAAVVVAVAGCDSADRAPATGVAAAVAAIVVWLAAAS